MPRDRGGQRSRWLLRAELLLGAGVLVAVSAVFVDSAVRELPEEVRLGRHLVAALGVTAAQSALVALAAWILVSVQLVVTGAVRERSPRLAQVTCAAFWALVLGAASWSTAHWAFEGKGVQGTWWGAWGALVAVVSIAVSTGVTAHLVDRSWAAIAAGRARRALAVAALLAAGAATLAYVDLTVYVALYARLHTMLEAGATALGLASFSLGLGAVGALWKAARGSARSLAVLAAGWLLVFSAAEPVRSDLDRALGHVWRHPMYVGRALQRLQLAESFLADPVAWQGAGMARVQRLRDRFDIESATESPEWSRVAPPLAPSLERAVSELRSRLGVRNVLIYYVDTLRADAAADAAIMPSVARFSRESIAFTRAYSAAPDTVGALPVMLTGRFTLDDTQPDLLRAAVAGGARTALVIAQSAGEFLARHLPAFRFQETLAIGDYAPTQHVWGYGADQPTAASVVDTGLTWIDEHREDRFLLWLFQYDLHNWRELDRPYVYETAARLNVPDEATLNWRYRVVAASVDAQFGRLLDGLERRGLDKDTVVVVLADHGEALGAGGFWVHGIFLWDMLVRVPLAIRVPGVPPCVVDMPVGHVDLASTLLPFLAPRSSLGLQHGEDLLHWIADPTHVRRLPLLMGATSHNELVRLGIVDPHPPLKLVLPIESSEPELYDVDRVDPDDHDLAATESARLLPLLDQLVRSPLFPRVPSDLTGARWRTPSSSEDSSQGQRTSH